MIAIDKNMAWLPPLGAQGVNGAGHGKERRLEDVDLVDFLDRRDANADLTLREDLRFERRPALGREFFGIVEAVNRFVTQDDGRRDNRTRKGSATGFIDASDQCRQF